MDITKDLYIFNVDGLPKSTVVLQSYKTQILEAFLIIDSHGNMGMTARGNERKPIELFPELTIVKIASGADHLVMLSNHGDIYTCGCAEQGQLGRTTERGSGRESRTGIVKLLQPGLVQTKLSLKLLFTDIWAGSYCTFAKVLNKDDIYVFGLNNFNQIGLKKPTAHFNPTLSKEFSKYKWKQICSATHHTVALNTEGKVYVIGRKEYGRLGLGDACEDATELKEIPLFANNPCSYISCGSSTSFAVTKNGELYAWGMGSSGQLGTGKEDDCFEPTLIASKQLQQRSVLKVSSGGQHAVILAATRNNNSKTDVVGSD